MSVINQTDGDVSIYCDKCHRTRTGVGFWQAFNLIKQETWRYYKDAGTWRHICPTCDGEEPDLNQVDCSEHFEDLTQSEGKTTMNYSAAISIASDEVQAVTCRFSKNGKTYTYKALGLDLDEGDHVVIQSANASTGFDIVTVVSLDDDFDVESNIQYKWVVCKVDTAALDRTLEIEKQAIKKLRKAYKSKKRKEAVQALIDLDKEEFELIESQVSELISGEVTIEEKENTDG